MSNDCVLVQMPFATTNRPSIALGILQSQLAQSGISATTLYGNLRFAQQSGMSSEFLSVLSWDSMSMLGDSLFVSAAFPGSNLSSEEIFTNFYKTRLSAYPETSNLRGWETLDRLREWVEDMRGVVSGFIDDLVDEALAHEPKVVGCSSVFSQHVSSLGFLRRLREREPHVVTLLGGPNCEAEMGLATHREFEWVDYVVSGEADDLIVPLVSGILEKGGGLRPKDVDLGVFVPMHRREGYPKAPGASGTVPRAVSRGFADNPTPDYRDYFEQLSTFPDIQMAQEPRVLYETSRGCWWGQKHLCRFCGLNGFGLEYRAKSPETIMEQLQELVERHDVRTVLMADNIFHMPFFKTLLPQLAEAGWAKDCRFFFEVKSNLSREQVQQLADAGICSIQAGIEGLHSEQLELMKKGVRAHQNIELLKWCVESGVHALWHILHGFPGENDGWYQEMAEIIPQIVHLPPPGNLIQVDFCRFSEYFIKADEWGLSVAPNWQYRHVYPVDQKVLTELAYHFSSKAPIDGRLGSARVGLMSLAVVIQKWKQRWTREQRPSLTLYPGKKGGASIADTRDKGAGRSHSISPMEHAILIECRTAVHKKVLSSRISVRGFSNAEIESALKRLVDCRVCLEIDGKILNLALDPPEAEYPPQTIIF